MRTYVINLARRPDRLTVMHRMLTDLGLAYERIEALDVQTASRHAVTEGFSDSMARPPMPGDMACSQSHRRAWRTFWASGASYGLFLEDDVTFTPEGGALLRDDRWIPPTVDLLKLELTGRIDRRVLVRRLTVLDSGYRIGLLCSRHAGAGAYILSRRGAEILLQSRDWRWPVDQILFNPEASPLYRTLKPCQLLPAIARQREMELVNSDLLAERLQRRRQRKSHTERFRHALAELIQVPHQAAAFLRGGRYTRLCPPTPFEPSPPAAHV